MRLGAAFAPWQDVVNNMLAAQEAYCIPRTFMAGIERPLCVRYDPGIGDWYFTCRRCDRSAFGWLHQTDAIRFALHHLTTEHGES